MKMKKKQVITTSLRLYPENREAWKLISKPGMTLNAKINELFGEWALKEFAKQDSLNEYIEKFKETPEVTINGE
jgi:hypothetical protein